MYGIPYLIFPIGDYSAYFSPDINDLYFYIISPTNYDDIFHFIDYARYIGALGGEISDKSLIDYCKKHNVSEYVVRNEKNIFDSLIKNYKKFDSVNTEIMTKNHEIIIDCKNYYLVNKKYEKDVIQLIYELKD